MDPKALRFGTDDVKKNFAVAAAAIQGDKDAWRDVDTNTMSKNKSLILLALKHGIDVLENPLQPELYSDEEVMGTAVSYAQDAMILERYDSKLIDDKKFMLMVADIDQTSAYHCASDILKNDEDFIRATKDRERSRSTVDRLREAKSLDKELRQKSQQAREKI